MNTIEELEYYCRESEPVGALLLSGEWGCGKTYLIEHNLKETLTDIAVVLRISLFGMALPEEINTAVRNKWIEEYCRIKGMNSIAKKLVSGKKLLAKLDFLPEWLRQIATTDISAFFPIGNELEGKKVILVFDDLERCRINCVDVLGVINDYCENQKFHTIVVANQEKIKSQPKVSPVTGEIVFPDNNGDPKGVGRKAVIKVDIPVQAGQEELSYTEVKEKIIQRTVRYLPNYEEIVHSVIASIKFEDDRYKEFIESCENGLLELFAPDRHNYRCEEHQQSTNERREIIPPHNIRSLKCAIKDFFRLYRILNNHCFQDLDKWLYSFASYVLANKADIANEKSYSSLFSDDQVRNFYPAFQQKYTLSSIKRWVLHGVWDSKAIEDEIAMIEMRDGAKSAPEIIKSSRIMDIDDAVIQSGFSDFLRMAYNGDLTLEEYVLLIKNSCWARHYLYELPISIDWEKVKMGIETRFNQIRRTLPEGQLLYSVISADQRSYYTDEEWTAYELISDFALGGKLVFYKNKKLYIDKLNEFGATAFLFIRSKRYDAFDEEMAEVTAQAFEREDNAGKNQFVSEFNSIWSINVKSPETRLADSIKGFQKLTEYLKKILSNSSKGKRNFSIVHTERFVGILNALVDSYKNELSAHQNHYEQ